MKDLTRNIASVAIIATLSVSGTVTHAATSGYQTYRDPNLGFSLERPAGWTVKADGHTIIVQSPDHAQTVFAELFQAREGESAKEHLAQFSEKRAALFPNAQIGGIAPAAHARGDEVAGTLKFDGKGVAGSGRILCSIVDKKGMVYALTAPASAFPARRATLLHVVKSLRFSVPKAASSKGDQVSAAQIKAVTKSLNFVKWTDPKEHAFTMEVPKGWQVDGGTFRDGPTNVRQAYQVTSPDHNVSIIVGNPNLPPSIMTPNAQTQQMGWKDGTNGVMHYMPAIEFNHWYLGQIGPQVMKDTKAKDDHPLTDLSKQMTEVTQKMMGSGVQITISMGITEFGGKSKLTGKPVTGVIISSTNETSMASALGPSASWFAMPTIIACTDLPGQEKYQLVAMAVYIHMQQSLHYDEGWSVRRTRELGQVGKDMIALNAKRSQIIARESSDREDAIMGNYWNHVNAGNERQRGFVNYIGDRTDVTDGAGSSANVASGSKHYYRNARTGTIIGTDSEASPGVDFSPLSQY